MKRLLIILIAIMTLTSSYGQNDAKKHEMFLKAGMGTSWIILPKVFIVDPVPPYDNAQIIPATNGVGGFIGLQTVFHLGDGWLFVPEVDVSYTSGEVRVNLTQYPNPAENISDTIRSSAQEMQSFVRAEIPLNFGVRSKDNFWMTFGPTLYFTLYDNKGFDKAVYSLPARPDLQLNSDNPFGVRFRLAAYAPIGKRSYLDFKFESDLGQFFRYENDTYEVKFSFQNVTIGYGFLLNAPD